MWAICEHQMPHCRFYFVEFVIECVVPRFIANIGILLNNSEKERERAESFHNGAKLHNKLEIIAERINSNSGSHFGSQEDIWK